jgi:ferritin-like metal-binding protein YciE
MSPTEEKLLQYLNEAHAAETALTRVLQSQILMTPRGRYRSLLERHLRETRDHGHRLEQRMQELGHGSAPLQALVGLAESVVGQLVALGKTPLDLVRGSGGEEKVLKNAKDTCASEALEIATYTAIECLARDVGDEETARLAISIRVEEERMLDAVLREIPRLTGAVVAAQLGGRRPDGATDRDGPERGRPRGRLKAVRTDAADLPIADYEKLTAAEIVARLRELAQADLATVEDYERRHQDRSTVLDRISSMRTQEPWPGFDALTAGEIRPRLEDADQELANRLYEYERAHKNRSSVLEVAARERERTHV